MKRIITTTLFTLTAALVFGCSESKTGKSGTDIKSGAASSRGALTSQKPANPNRTMSAPRSLPQIASAGSTQVEAPNPTGEESNQGDETWGFEEVDLDGDGEGESGDVLFDDESDTLYVWFSDADDFGDGREIEYNAMVWISADESVGFILEVPGEGVLACAADATGSGGCVVCDQSGCKELGLDGEIGAEEELEEPGFEEEYGDEYEGYDDESYEGSDDGS